MIFSYLKRKKRDIECSGLAIITIETIYKWIEKRNLNSNVDELLHQEFTYNYLEKYDYIFERQFSKVSIANLEKKVWTCWLQGENEAPDLVKKCIASIRMNSNGYHVVALDKNNFSDWVSLPSYVIEKWNKGIISDTHFSDILRMELLSQYGGVWIDATVYLTGQIAEVIAEETVFFYKAPLTLESCRKGSSWFIAAEANCELIQRTRDLLYEYWKNEIYLRDYFLLHMCIARVIDRNLTCASIYNQIPYFDDSAPNYLRVHFNDLFNDDEWTIMKRNTSVHKLNWKLISGNPSKDSFYEYFLKDNLI